MTDPRPHRDRGVSHDSNYPGNKVGRLTFANAQLAQSVSGQRILTREEAVRDGWPSEEVENYFATMEVKP